MQMVEEILNDGQTFSLEKIERLEAILSAAAAPNDVENSDSNRSSPTKYICTMCQGNNKNSLQKESKVQKKEATCQTISTGDIAITKIYSADEDARERLRNNPKKQLV